MSGLRMERAFTWDGVAGSVRVDCVPNDDPAFLGSWLPTAHGFPVLTATVQYPQRGYRGMFGWVQLVRSSDNPSGGRQFDVDPFALFGDAPSPYCFYGTEPTLFDAPTRATRDPLQWTAHSFLATTPTDEVMQGGPRRVVPVLGFSWGFELAGDAVRLEDITPLSADEWIMHLPVLRASYPYWTFADDADL